MQARRRLGARAWHAACASDGPLTRPPFGWLTRPPQRLLSSVKAMPSADIRVAIVEDQQHTRDGLAALDPRNRRDTGMIGAFGSMEAALARIRGVGSPTSALCSTSDCPACPESRAFVV